MVCIHHLALWFFYQVTRLSRISATKRLATTFCEGLGFTMVHPTRYDRYLQSGTENSWAFLVQSSGGSCFQGPCENVRHFFGVLDGLGLFCRVFWYLLSASYISPWRPWRICWLKSHPNAGPGIVIPWNLGGKIMCNWITGWWCTYPAEEYESQLELLFPTYGKS